MIVGDLVLLLSGNAGGLSKTLDQSRGKLHSFVGEAKGSLSGLTGALSGLAAPVIGMASFAGMIAVLKEGAAHARHLRVESESLGVGVVMLQQMERYAERVGIGAEVAEKGIVKLQRSIMEGLEKKDDPFKRLGLSAKDLANMLPEEQLTRVAEAIMGIRSATVRTAVELDLFGKAGKELEPILAEIAKGKIGGKAGALDLTGAEAYAAESIGPYLGLGKAKDWIYKQLMTGRTKTQQYMGNLPSDEVWADWERIKAVESQKAMAAELYRQKLEGVREANVKQATEQEAAARKTVFAMREQLDLLQEFGPAATAAEKALAAMAQAGASPEALENFRAMGEMVRVITGNAGAMKTAQGAMGDLSEQINTFGMSSREKMLSDVRSRLLGSDIGGSREGRAQITEGIMTGLGAKSEQLGKLEKEKTLRGEAAEIIKRTITDYGKLEAALGKIDMLRERGLLTEEQANRAGLMARETYAGTLPKESGPIFAGAAERGSREAYSGIMDTIRQATTSGEAAKQKAAVDTAKNTARTAENVAAVRQALQDNLVNASIN